MQLALPLIGHLEDFIPLMLQLPFFRISRDFNIVSFVFNPKKIVLHVLSRFSTTLHCKSTYDDILQTALGLYDLSSKIFCFRSQYPLIYGCLYLGKLIGNSRNFTNVYKRNIMWGILYTYPRVKMSQNISHKCE